MAGKRTHVDMGILTGLVKQQNIGPHMPKGVQARKWKEICEIYNELLPRSDVISMDTLQSHYEEFIGVSEETRPSKRRRTAKEEESDSDSDDCEVVTTAHVKRSKKNWKKVLRSLAASESTTTSWGPTGNGANIVLWYYFHLIFEFF